MLFDVDHDADNGRPADLLGIIEIAKGNPVPERVLVGEKLPRKRLVHDDDLRLSGPVMFVEEPAAARWDESGLLTTRGQLFVRSAAHVPAELPRSLMQTLSLGKQGALSAFGIIAIGVLAVAVTFFIVFIERSQRRISDDHAAL